MRNLVLDQAKEYISGERNENYGTAERNFNRIAALWTAYRDDGLVYTGADVAVMMTLLKLSRLRETPTHLDSWVDIAGYSALGAEVTINAS